MNARGHGAIHFVDWDYCYIPEILHEIYLQKIYAPFLNGMTDGVFLDIGCNIGLWSLYATNFAKQIYAFEPAKAIAKVAETNFKDNGIKNVKLFTEAIAPDDGTTTFHHNTNKTMYSLNPVVNNTKESEEVKTIRLDTMVKREGITHIDFAKIDIEGIEDKLFLSDGFKAIVPILDSFIYEWHAWANANPNIINGYLRELGYVAKQIQGPAILFGVRKA